MYNPDQFLHKRHDNRNVSWDPDSADPRALGTFLVGLNVLLPFGVQALALHESPAFQGNLLLSMGLGWEGAQVPLLGLWLTWGGLRLVPRLALVLSVLAGVWAVQTQTWNAESVENLDFNYLLIALVLVLALHALLLPLRDLLGWRLVRQVDPSPEEPQMQWSLMHLLAWTVFLAAPLTFLQILSDLSDATMSRLEVTLMMVGALVDTLIRTALVAGLFLACLARYCKRVWRMATVVACFVVALAYRRAFVEIAGIPEGLLQSQAWAGNLWLAGVVNAGAFGLAGLQLVRVLQPPTGGIVELGIEIAEVVDE